MTKVIAVHSFKGGTGKTTLTANLAAILAKNRRVGVMDLDLSGPGLHVLFGVKKSEIKATLTDIFLGDPPSADVVIDLTKRFTLKKGGLFFCPASNKVEDMLRLLKSGLEVEIFQDTIQKVGEQNKLDYIIVDTHPGVENDTVLAMGCCDALVLVSRVDQQDLFGTAVMVLLAETFEKPTFLTLNMIPPGVRIKDAIKVGQELSQLFRSRFLQAFEFQLDVINNLSRSVFVVDNPDSSFAKKVTEAVDTLERELSGATKIANRPQTLNRLRPPKTRRIGEPAPLQRQQRRSVIFRTENDHPPERCYSDYAGSSRKTGRRSVSTVPLLLGEWHRRARRKYFQGEHRVHRRAEQTEPRELGSLGTGRHEPRTGQDPNRRARLRQEQRKHSCSQLL